MKRFLKDNANYSPSIGHNLRGRRIVVDPKISSIFKRIASAVIDCGKLFLPSIEMESWWPKDCRPNH